MAKKKKTRGIIDDLNVTFEASERDNRNQDRINPESYEEGSDPHYEAWKNDEQGRRMKRDIARLQSKEKDNCPRSYIKSEIAKIEFFAI